MFSPYIAILFNLAIISEKTLSPPTKVTEDTRQCHAIQNPKTALAACYRLIDNKIYSAQLRSLAHTRRGQIYARRKYFTKASKAFSKAILLKNDAFEAYFNRGVVYSLTRHHDKAIRDYTKAITFKSDYVMAYYNRGTALARQKLLTKAIADFNKTIELKPSFWRAYVNRGTLYHKTGQMDKAIADFGASLTVHPKNHAALMNRAALHLKAGNKKKAFQDFTAGLKLPNDHRHIYLFQLKLKRLGFYHGTVTGTCDAKTQTALKNWLLNNEVIQ